jgi:hypothetical protein
MSVKTLDWFLLRCSSRCKVSELLHKADSGTYNISGGSISSTTQIVLLYANYTIDIVIINTDNSVEKWLRKKD